MDKSEMERQIIENYQKDEKMMILIYAQWCINNDIDPGTLYKNAYPNQINNNALTEALELTVPAKDSDEISDLAVLNVLQLFGNDDLAFLVQGEIEKRKNK
ncbi:hypothetical protein QGM71_14205 [Virgibacillus sp. C22-A2]|uniref:Phage protein n=1 Tax=Virgibacillus tibetensis TaxID=3042313 RepID=A0ABU6KH53_9BACI|nr:hypothetical protein [Virgibacillus sp. C22-A2]